MKFVVVLSLLCFACATAKPLEVKQTDTTKPVVTQVVKAEKKASVMTCKKCCVEVKDCMKWTKCKCNVPAPVVPAPVTK